MRAKRGFGRTHTASLRAPRAGAGKTQRIWTWGGTTIINQLMSVLYLKPPKKVVQLTPNPNKCTHYLRAISTKIEMMSTTTAVTTENSSDLSSGRRPVSKSVEFAVVTAMVVEI